MSTVAVHHEVTPSAFEQAATEGKLSGERFLRRLDADAQSDALFAKILQLYDPADPDLQPRLRAFCRQVQIALVERGEK